MPHGTQHALWEVDSPSLVPLIKSIVRGRWARQAGDTTQCWEGLPVHVLTAALPALWK